MKFLFFANNPDVSFGKQVVLLENQLIKLGHRVIHIDHNTIPELKKIVIQNYQPDVVVVWTFFHDIGHPTMSIKELPEKRDFFLIGFEVSDTTRLSQKAIDMVNELNPDILLTPSKWSKEGFKGVKVPVEVLPHAIDPLIKTKTNSKIYDLENNRKKVYVFASHSPVRKGLDIVLKVIPEICEKYEITVIYKTWNVPERLNCKTYYSIGHVPAHIHYSIMNYSTHFFYPVRGGAFEIPVLEMLALGKTVIIPEKGAWTDIPLDRNDVYWIKVKGLKRYWWDNPYHVGEFVEPDTEDAKEKLEEALKNPLTVDGEKYFKHYSPENITKMFLSFIRK